MNKLEGHSSPVLCSILFPISDKRDNSQKYLITGSSTLYTAEKIPTGEFKIWDLKTGELKNKSYGHKKAISAIAIIAKSEKLEDNYLVTGSEDGSIIIWKYQEDKDSFNFDHLYDLDSPHKKDIKSKITNYLQSINIIYRELSSNEINELVRVKRDKTIDTNQKIPYDYQLQIINKAKNYFTSNNKGLLVLICGVGKTLISSWITKELGYKKIVIGVPNTVLLEQWENEIKNIFSEYKILKVQSGIDIKEIQKFMKNNDLIIILTTYASSYKIRSLDNHNFDMKICDEAHHLTTSNMNFNEITKDFVEFLKIKSNKQLSLTATLKYLQNSDPDKNTVSNESIEYFGDIIERKSLLWAINKNIVCDYQIQTILSDKAELEKYLDELEIETESDARLFLSAYASLQSINLGKSHHLLIYSNNKENSIKIIRFIINRLMIFFNLIKENIN
jgi:superfamily II DNA or RNA helicase